MKLYIDVKGKKYLWKQVYDQIIHKIINGELKPGQELPSVRQLSKISGICECTVNRAYDKLKSDGYIYSVNTNGHYVSEDVTANRIRKKHLMIISDAIDEIIQAGAQLGMSEAEIIRLFEKRRAEVV